MNKYTLYWKAGKKETIEGNDLRDALERAGYPETVLVSISHVSLDENDYWWDSERKCWSLNNPESKPPIDLKTIKRVEYVYEEIRRYKFITEVPFSMETEEMEDHFENLFANNKELFKSAEFIESSTQLDNFSVFD
jgi:hypothetical protein